jgi:hypothetical protein
VAKKQHNRTPSRPAHQTAAALAPRVVSLGGGTHAYLVVGKTHHVAVDSDEFDAIVATLEPGLQAQVISLVAERVADSPGQKWAAQLARLEALVAAAAVAEAA